MTRPTQRTIFLEAIDQEDADLREAYLNSACGDDGALRASVDALLAAHDRPANPLDSPPLDNRSMSGGGGTGLDITLVHDSIASVQHEGMTIDSYRLMELIGEGGFGLVFVAQQEQPVRRKVALKIIKPGTESKEVLARFAAERQSVALMDHPNIARIFDAGVTDDARPYFVMELVRGEPITEFCDRHAMTVRQRLELFQDVCAATHHAHQKGVVHRDLKPSNVMVTLHDDKPVVKVIDFGVAKAIGQNLTDQTIYTRFYSMIGTPLYMSPEQAAMSGLDVDTRSDIYSLGVLLYEILTGTTPFDRERLDSAGYDEMRRIIREEEPPKPSSRLTTIQSEKLPTVVNRQSKNAATSAHWPSREKRESIPSDLDWIVMKAMEKDRKRRYESAAAMSADLRRFLSEEPIEARPPSRGYRLSKFAGRNRVALMTGSLVMAALVLGTLASLYQASQAIAERNEKDIALQEKENALSDAIAARLEVENFAERLKTANVLVGNARTNEDADQFAEADRAYSEAVALVPNYYLVWIQRAMLRARLNLWNEAAEDYSAAMRLEAPLDSRQWQGAAALFALTERMDDYRTIYSRLMTPLLDDSRPRTWNSIRSCLVAPLDSEDAQRIAAAVESLMAQPDGPPPGPPRRPSGIPGDPSHEFFPPPRGPDFGIAGPGRGPNGPRQGGPRGPGGPGGPSSQDHLPRSVEQYIAGWANLRAGNETKALEYLALAADSRGPSGNLVHSLSAIALHRLGQTEESRAALKRADQALDDVLQVKMLGTSDDQWPWIDFVEMVLLHREATLTVTGKSEGLDPRIIAAQQQTRELLGLE